MALQREERYPLVRYYESDEYAERDLGEPLMEFRLVYQGPLLAERSLEDLRIPRSKHKHAIRRRFSEQLAELWKLDSRLSTIASGFQQMHDATTGVTTTTTNLEELGKLHTVGDIKWAPLVSDRTGTACSLNILFLRHEPKGGVIKGGDLDNRIKTLFDGLRMAQGPNEIPEDIVPANEPNPFFCLLSDDKLITDFRVTADRLLIPNSQVKLDSDVHLIIEIKTFIADHMKAQYSLMGGVHW